MANNERTGDGGRYDFGDGGSYYGGWEKGKAHGYGVCTGPNNEGEFSGKWHFGAEISGCYVWPSVKCRYEGEWQESRQHGLGVEIKERWVYRGEWNKGNKGRYGVRHSRTSGAKYEGTWSSGLQDGAGVETYADGGTYAGQWAGGVRNGLGIRNSVPYGAASVIHPPNLRDSLTSVRSSSANANIEQEDLGQRGGFVLKDESDTDTASKRSLGRRSKSSGTGEHRSRRGPSEWQSGSSSRSRSESRDRRQAGPSRSRLPRSVSSTRSAVSNDDETFFNDTSSYLDEVNVELTETYIGQWKQDKRNGVGISQRSDGLCYSGQWQNNKKHGYGMSIYPDGSEESGRWKNNTLVASSKKKIFGLKTSRINDKVAFYMEQARQTVASTKVKAEIAESRASYAREKAEKAQEAAEIARINSENAKESTRMLMQAQPTKTNGKSDKKKGFFNRFMRTPTVKGQVVATVKSREPTQALLQPPSRDFFHSHGAGGGGSMGGRSKSVESMDRRHDRFQMDSQPGLPPDSRMSGASSYHFEIGQHGSEGGHGSYAGMAGALPLSSYGPPGHYDSPDDRSPYHRRRGDRTRLYGNSSSELTQDSGIGTDRSHYRDYRESDGGGEGKGHRRYRDDEPNDLSLEDIRLEGATAAVAPADNSVADESTGQKQKKWVLSKPAPESPTAKVPPGHVRKMRGHFPDGCSIEYVPKENDRPPGQTDSDGDGAASNISEWATNGPTVFLVLLLNIGFTVAFSQWFQELRELQPDD